VTIVCIQNYVPWKGNC